MRPDRIVVEEILGEETSEFVNAMNRGHDGSMLAHWESPWYPPGVGVK
jgi:Flp pilus assembly CpaF family ATPase